MCMLFGFSATTKYELSDLIKNFFAFSPKHPHGWGVALYEKPDSSPMIAKEASPAYKSNYAKLLTNNGIYASLAIAHIRYKTKANIHYLNTHPFIRRIEGAEWVLAHNGRLSSPYLKNLEIKPQGETGSEKILCFMASRMKKLAENSTNSNKTQCIEECISLLSQGGKVNLLLTDGKRLYVHTNCVDTLYTHKDKGVAIFCTKPLTNGKWDKVPLNRLLVYENGEEIYQGIPHEYEHKDAEV